MLFFFFFFDYVINSPPRSTHILPGSNRKSCFKFLVHTSLVYTCKVIPSFSVDACPIVLHSVFVQTTAFACRLHLVLVLVETLCELHYFFNWPWISGGLIFPWSTHLCVVKNSPSLPSKKKQKKKTKWDRYKNLCNTGLLLGSIILIWYVWEIIFADNFLNF